MIFSKGFSRKTAEKIIEKLPKKGFLIIIMSRLSQIFAGKNGVFQTQFSDLLYFARIYH